MKIKLTLFILILPASLILSTFSSNAQTNQGTHTLTTVLANITSSRAVINLNDLNGKPDAIIVATPVGNAKTINPHPNGVWYYAGKWNFFNTDHSAMIVGLVYNLTYFVSPSPGSDQFLHAVTQQNLVNGVSYITHAKLDNNPNAQFAFFQNHSPDLRPGSVLNMFEEKIGYSTTVKKWYITNVSSVHPLVKGAWYNIVVSPGPTLVTTITPPLLNGAVVNPTTNSSTQPCNCPASLPPNGTAGGDLAGAYPNPSVQKLFGQPLSPATPVTGQVLKWNGSVWEPAADNSAPAASNKPSVLFFTQSGDLQMQNPTINKASITGMDNRSFPIAQNSRVVFNTVLTVYNKFLGSTIYELRPVDIWLTVEILNSSNETIALAVGTVTVKDQGVSTIHAVGIGIVPPGTYHTRVTLNRQNQGSPLTIIASGFADTSSNGGIMIIEIFPD